MTAKQDICAEDEAVICKKRSRIEILYPVRLDQLMSTLLIWSQKVRSNTTPRIRIILYQGGWLKSRGDISRLSCSLCAQSPESSPKTEEKESGTQKFHLDHTVSWLRTVSRETHGPFHQLSFVNLVVGFC